MAYKARTESAELLILRTLATRMDSSDKDKQYYFNLKKGYEGELLFDSWTEKLQCECLILNDLLLKQNNTVFQIDSLLILSDCIYFFEVKNYEGDYYYDSDRLYKTPKSEVMNPLTQLSRSESLLRQLLQNLGCQTPITSSVVFINPEFTLYQAPLGKPFIFPSQLGNYFKKLDSTPSKLNGTHKLLADKLISLHLTDSPFRTLPSYDFDSLRKGITCVDCSSFSIRVEGRKCICEACGHEELSATSVMRSVMELKLLFPNERITTNCIYDWCNGVLSKKRIRSSLGKNFEMVGVHQWSFYK